MSTKAIREVLGAAGFAAPDTNDEAMARKVAAAYAEVEAIEKAAKVVSEWGICMHGGEPGDIPGTAEEIETAQGVMESTSENAP